MDIVVRPLVPDAALDRDYDLVVGAVGYESRSRFIAESLRGAIGQLTGIAFPGEHSVKFEENVRVYRARRADVSVVEDSEFAGFIVDECRKLRELTGPRPCSVLVDCSSMTRLRMASTLLPLLHNVAEGSVITIAYAPAEFDPEAGSSGPLAELKALPGLSGGLSPAPLALLLGLGFEADLALNVMEYFGYGAAWCFVPSGVDVRYDETLIERNDLVFHALGEGKSVNYDVLDIYGQLLALDSFVDFLQPEMRPAIVPLGPKSFCMAAIVVSILRRRQVSVWRASSLPGIGRVDRVPLGVVVGVELEKRTS